MKVSIRSIAIAVLLAACSEDPEPTYTSLVGKWKFAISTVAITGNFEISDRAGVLTVDNRFGEFKLKGTTYKIDNNYAMESGAPGRYGQLKLLHNATPAFVSFIDSESSKDFKTITAQGFQYGEGNSTSGVI